VNTSLEVFLSLTCPFVQERYHWGRIGARLHIYRVLAFILDAWMEENPVRYGHIFVPMAVMCFFHTLTHCYGQLTLATSGGS
jgi:hypothetical protein